MDEQEFTNPIPEYPVRIWEVILILFGAIAITSITGLGLGLKLWSNANDPQRAEAIARSIVDYQIPGGSQGIFGINIGSAKVALVRSRNDPPDVVLFVGRTPITKESTNPKANGGEFGEPTVQASPETPDEEFTIASSRVETKSFCGKPTPVTVETGEQRFKGPDLSVPAVRYSIESTENDIEQIIILTANGKDAPKKAEAVLRSFSCKSNAVNK